ncbi:hypothetical protein ACWE42_23325, partial [Sutcliffiella cohnii]
MRIYAEFWGWIAPVFEFYAPIRELVCITFSCRLHHVNWVADFWAVVAPVSFIVARRLRGGCSNFI